MNRFALALTLSTLLPIAPIRAEIRLADGLSIELVADDQLVPDCAAIGVDTKGRIFAACPGSIRMPQDADGDGRFDQFRTVVKVSGRAAQGLCLEAGRLYYVANGGVWQIARVEFPNNSEPKRVFEIQTGGEHDAHALRKGPDGSWYLIVGNGPKNMFALQNVDHPVIANPRAGAIWRISPDWQRREVWAHGFRNAYDFDFGPHQTIDTFDSDGERDTSLPWYRPTRVFRVSQGDDAGWVTRSWKRPNFDPQMPRVLARFGRGSPTGVLRYRHQRLPARFHQGVFVLDWTFGRILFVADDGNTELVAHATGTTGFAVTDIACLPDGRLVVSIGGRGSRGGLYVIDAAEPHSSPTELAVTKGKTATDRGKTSPPSRTVKWITRLRSRSAPAVDVEAAIHALDEFDRPGATHDQRIAALTLLIESVGGLGAGDPKDARGKEQVAAVFDGYRSRLRPKLSPEVIQRAAKSLTDFVQSTQTKDEEQEELVGEAIRTLAVLEPESLGALKVILDDLDRVEDPTDKLHRLIAAARIPAPRSDEFTQRIAAAMLEITALIDQLSLSLERNWTPRLGELFLALGRRDSLLPSRLVSDPRFGHVSHLVWTERMDPENLERARIKCLMQSRNGDIDPKIARFIALGNDAVPRPFIRRWLSDPATRSAAFLAIARHPKQTDAQSLQQAALSTDLIVREAAIDALERLGVEIPEREPTSENIRRWLERSDSITELVGDPKIGRELFVKRQCAACHGGSKALGPSLQGVSKRFNRQDLLRATVDPSHHIPDRYRSQQVLTTDGEVITGMAIYSSNDGLTLMTADGKTQRINAASIVESKVSSQSLMPEGLIDGLSDQQVADLLAILQSL